MIDRIKSIFSSDESPEIPVDTGPNETEEALASELQQKQQEISELEDELDDANQSRAHRMAEVEERLQEVEHQKKELEEKLQQQQEQMSDMQGTQKAGTARTPPPDSELLKGKPVVSADGGRVFGLFAEWISDGDKLGIKCVDSMDRNQITKVGMADEIRDLVIDPGTMNQKSVIITKFDAQMEMMDYASARYVQEVLQENERLEDKVSRFSQQNQELVDQNQKLEALRDKLFTQLSASQVKKAEAENDVNKDMVINELLQERDLNHSRMDNMSKQVMAQRNRENEIIEEYEGMHDEDLQNLGRTQDEQAMDQARDNIKRSLGITQDVFDELPQELREELAHGGEGGAMTIRKED